MRTKPDHYYEQSAVIPYRLCDGAVELLLITSRKRKRWVLPKGVREPDLSPARSAAKEALEEAGIMGPVSAEPVGRYEYRKWGGTCRVEVFTMEVEALLDRWPEQFRDRQWLTPEEAAARVDEPELQWLLLRAAGRLERSRASVPAATIPPMQPIKLRDRAAALTAYFSPQVIGEVNDVYVKVAKIKGDEIPWHSHAGEDELFYVIDGRLLFEVEGQEPFTMEPGDLFIVRRGVNHRVSSAEECSILLVENKSTAHLGDTESEIARSVEEQLEGYLPP